ncbi:MAG TPA: class II D-tagatose-bisphosphate aldolase, non-catalytic subunit, partial [Spirochaetia bacterium]|nr:class II D-tagatose-bisphosphate aldolase, non-catalytic subunit [Spirochaetia bacterium]
VRNGRPPAATRPEDLHETIETHEHLFHESGLDDAWSRVIAVVVHPGIEFNALRVFPYSREAATGLRETLKSFPGLFLEGHSTDYQSTPSLRALVEDGFAVLKVGPELTFTLREQLFSLERIEQEMVDAAVRSRLRETVLAAMTEDPKPWRGYYAEGPDLSWSMTYAYSDRARYYWEVPKVARSVRRLLSNLEEAHVPLPLISQHIPHLRPAADLIECTPTELVLQGIEGQLERYVMACGSVRLAGEG